MTTTTAGRATHPSASFTHAELVELVLDLDRQLGELRARLDTVEQRTDTTSPRKRERDELDERILRFLADFPALRFPAGGIAENLADDGHRVQQRVAALADSKRIESEKRDGKVRVYWHKQATSKPLRGIPGGAA